MLSHFIMLKMPTQWNKSFSIKHKKWKSQQINNSLVYRQTIRNVDSENSIVAPSTPSLFPWILTWKTSMIRRSLVTLITESQILQIQVRYQKFSMEVDFVVLTFKIDRKTLIFERNEQHVFNFWKNFHEKTILWTVIDEKRSKEL